MTPDPTPTGFLPLPGQTILSLHGSDRLRFLNGQVTNDVRLADAGACIPAAVLDAKGKLEATCHIRGIDDSYVIDAHPSLRESLPARLDRYLIADDVEISDLTESWHVVHVIGTQPPALPGAHSFPANRFGVPGSDIFSPTPIHPDLPELSAECVENLRIGHGIPLWPHELHPGILPAEAGLDATAVSFDKGCYLGQEVVSRMKRAGKTNQHLVLASVPDGTTSGTALVHEDREAGTITSVSPHVTSDGRRSALAYRRRKFEDTDKLGCDGGTVEVLRRIS